MPVSICHKHFLCVQLADAQVVEANFAGPFKFNYLAMVDTLIMTVYLVVQLVMCAQQTAWAARALLAPPVEVLAQARPPGFAMMAQAWVAE